MAPLAEKITTKIKHHFGVPRFVHWGYPVFVMAVMLALVYCIECIAVAKEFPVPSTSLAGCSVYMLLNVFLCLILPSFALCKGFEDNVMGEYSGVGILALSLASGFPMMLISSSLHNLLSWLWLRFDLKIVFPAFFYTGGTESTEGFIMSLISDSILPAFGISLFFYGLLWSRFRSREKAMAIAVIAVIYTLYSLNVIDSTAILICGVWLGMLRERAGNMFAPFLCLIGMKVAELSLTSVLTEVDITTVQTYSDIPSTFLYASAPALFLGVVLLYFIKVLADNFRYAYFSDPHGVATEEEAEEDRAIPAFVKGLCPALLIGMAILAILSIMVMKGVHI